MVVPSDLIRKLVSGTWQRLKPNEKRSPKDELEKYLRSVHTATLELEHSTAFPSTVAKVLSQGKETSLSFASFSIYLLNRRSQQITHYLLHPPPVGWATLSLSEVPKKKGIDREFAIPLLFRQDENYWLHARRGW